MSIKDTRKAYDKLSSLYDAAAHLYSGGKIRAVKAAQLDEMRPGDKILYAGVGTGEDAAMVARPDVKVTILDTSPLMLERAARRFQAAGVQGIEIICCDVRDHGRSAYYDIVIANFFLNIFSESTMKEVMARLAGMIKPGGKMLIGDYSFPHGRWPQRVTQRLYYFASMFSVWLFGGTTLHPIYDYLRYFEEVNLRTISVKRFRVSALWPASVETITAQKV
jgi:demethylmenaquinone methyltransferase/2-methoxy-6-polyprenyl-1,4-benzoquinol methylase